jgi:hypothetical protein
VTIAEAAQAALEKVLHVQGVHVRDAHRGALTERCHTCVALSEAVAAARVAAVEATTLPERPAHPRRKTGSKRRGDRGDTAHGGGGGC